MEEPGNLKLLSKVRDVTEIARRRGIRIVQLPVKYYGRKNWRQLKGTARVEKDDGWIGDAEIHWYEAHSVGRVQWKINRKLEP